MSTSKPSRRYRLFVLILLFLLGFLLAVTGVFAQKGLKRDIQNGDTIYYTTEKKVFAKSGSPKSVPELLKTSFYRYPTRYSLCLFIQTGRTSIFNIDRGSEASLIWSDKEQVSLSANNATEAKPSRINYGGWAFVFYSVSPSQLSALQQSPLKHIRVRSSVGWMNYDLTEKNAKTIMEQAKAIAR